MRPDEDVYKRQGTYSAAGTSASEASSTAAEELSGTLSMNGSTSMEKVIKAVNGAFMEKNKGVTAVSYTHLDVYKRQAL